MKKKLNRFYYRFLVNELEENQDRGIISKQQKEDMLTYYEEGVGLNFIRVLVTVGAVLIGLGFLLLVAGNWALIPDLLKVFILIITIGLFMGASYITEKAHPMTSMALLYTASIIFGSAIFLINDAYHLGLQMNTSYFIWILGVLALSALRKDLLLFLFAHVLALIYLFTSFNEFIFIQAILLLILFYLGNYYFKYKQILTFGTLVLSLVFMLYAFNYYDVSGFMTAWFFIIIGAAMYYYKHNLNYQIFQFVGLVSASIAAFTLTFKYVWEQQTFIDQGSYYSIPFTILYMIFLFTLLTKRHVTPLVIIGIFIMRFYFDTLYDFLPRSLFFIIGGVMVLGIGFYIERYRKVTLNDENTQKE
jgi:uncharacterized membrane protein